jgi:predicted RNA-binding protein associated with RNAse of E/G family
MTDTDRHAPSVVPTVDDLLEMAQNVSAGLVTREQYFAACQLRAERAVEESADRYASSRPWHLPHVHGDR